MALDCYEYIIGYQTSHCLLDFAGLSLENVGTMNKLLTWSDVLVENLLSCKGQVQTNQNSKSCSAVRECAELDLHLAFTEFFCSLPFREEGSFPVNTHPSYSIYGGIMEHISF